VTRSPEVQTLAELVAPVMRAWTLGSPFHDSAPRQVAEAVLAAGYMRIAERDVLRARVDLLTAALTEVATISRCDIGTTHYGPACVSCIVSGALTADRYRAQS